MIELEVAIKRTVFESTKEKVKGMNSEQLMMRVTNLLIAGSAQGGTWETKRESLH